MRVFVTGATGFIGTRLVPKLIFAGHDVTCLVRDIRGAIKLESLNETNLLEGDIVDPESLHGAIDGQDWVIHLAVLGHLNENTSDEDTYVKVNVEGTRNLLNECVKSGPNRILCFSSSAKYGIPGNDIIDENTPAYPVTPYGKSKLKADRVVKEYVESHNLPIVTLLFTHIYGPGETRDFLTICRMIQKGIFPQVGLQPNYYPALYIDDCVRSILLALERGRTGETYIITDDDPHDLKKIRKVVRQALDLPAGAYPFIPKTLGIVGATILESAFSLIGKASPVKAKSIRSIASGRKFSIEKSRRELGFVPETNMEEAVSRIVEWYLKQSLL